VHGSAPDIAGKNIANPLALIMSAEMMLHHIGEHVAGDKIRVAYDAVLSEGTVRTKDLGGVASTDQFTDALIAKLPKS
jgi:isocitrate dehydrogenase (NAD+)